MGEKLSRTIQIAIRIDQEFLSKFDVIAHRVGQNRSALIREAMRRICEEMKEK
jgi:metal-responsive CopG/Arc/MetJ family transcriptional regulator